MKTLVFILSAGFLAFNVLPSANGEIFTSVEHLVNNLHAEEELVASLEALITSEEARLMDLKRKLTYFKAKNTEAANPEAYLANPINAFQLIKRLTLDLSDVETMAAQNGYADFLKTIKDLRRTMLPNEEDLVGAGTALIRLQDTYDLKTADFSEGVLNGVRYNATLTVEDCLEIGIQTYNANDFYHAVLWLQEALRRFDTKGERNLKLRESILAYLAASFYKTSHVKAALAVTKLMVALNPDNQESRKYMQILMIEVAKLNEQTGEWGVDGPVFTDIHLDRQDFVNDAQSYKYTRNYELLCQGKNSAYSKDQRRLNCRYIDDRSAFLKIAPLKVEEVHRNPDILLFHEVISDSEIDEIKQLAKQKLQRATISDSAGANKPAIYRISKSGWLKDSESEQVRTLSRRVEDMTGMTVDTAEELQVVNYGIGGQYIPHYDFAKYPEKESFSNTGLGNRVSTVLFYMSDVEQGGATVFPLLNVGVAPRKGTAVFWYNLHKTGRMDFRTLHAGCPVLVGNKWVCNKWQHIVGQERKRPCDVQPDFPLDDPTIRF